ncbi:MAG TPA: glycerol-3-phosphate 1-O-acyltransferase PlsY [Alphaproteobacteria bacterium]|nr:glycerol-3-phosphate 1-O-acyltransferase PlsY [Alphaproteobacteria bacterium]
MDIIAYAIAYLIGSVPFGLVLTKLAGYGDIRAIGSGNIGATNVLRTGNKLLAACTLVLDSGKGAFAVLLLPPLLGGLPIVIGLAAILGHCFPIWLKFKGGKGVSTAIGILLAALPLTGLAAFAIWLGMAFTFRISSLAALTATAATPIITLLLYGPFPALVTTLIAALIIWRHKDNIRRLLKGEEPKIGKKK